MIRVAVAKFGIGVGKSTLINKAFGVDVVSYEVVATQTINTDSRLNRLKAHTALEAYTTSARR